MPMDKGSPHIYIAKSSAILIIDMINDFNFLDGGILQERSMPVAKNIFQLKKAAQEGGIPIIYVNDNFGKWRSNFHVLIDHCINDNTLGKDIVKLLKPDKEDYFVLKPMLSAFYMTTLEILLKELKIESLIITGIKTESCILSTVVDAYMRDYQITILEDCVASLNDNPKAVLEVLKNDFNADIWSSIDLKW